MWIVWGKKIRKQSLGYVSDWCSLCRAISPFNVFKTELVDHIYYIPFGKGKHVGNPAVCEGCGLTYETNVTKYRQLSPMKTPLNELTQTTFPGIKEYHRERLEVEERLKFNPQQLPKELRDELIKEPFALLAPLVEANVGGQTQIDKKTGLGLIATIFLPIVLFMVSGFTRQDGYATAAGVVFVIALLFTIYSLFMVVINKPRQFIQQSVIKPLAKCLSAVNPTREEIDDCYGRMNTMNLSIMKHVKPDKLWDEMKKGSVVGRFS